jgi:hypothetical protein
MRSIITLCFIAATAFATGCEDESPIEEGAEEVGLQEESAAEEVGEEIEEAAEEVEEAAEE